MNHIIITPAQLLAFQRLHYSERVLASTGLAKEHCEKTVRELNSEAMEPVRLYNEVKQVR